MLSVTGSLSTLVEAASLAFLFTFATVNVIATQYLDSRKCISITGTVVATIVGIILILRLIITALVPLLILVAFAALAVFGRPAILRRLKSDDD